MKAILLVTAVVAGRNFQPAKRGDNLRYNLQGVAALLILAAASVVIPLSMQ